MKIKHAFKIAFSGIMVKINAGPLNGKKWIVTSGGKFIKGTQELYKTEAFLKNFNKGEVFFDIGAHVGYFSAIAAVLNEGSGSIYAFEPRPMNAMFFKKHMNVNHFQNVTLFEAAVGESDGDVSFDTGHGSATGHVSQNGKIRVRQVSIDKMVKDGSLPSPGFIKIDVEGGEIEVLKGLKDVIFSARPKMIVATHNPECHKYVVDFLRQNKYRFEILNPDSIKGDTEIVALPD
ncbi:MAG: FkbM family methyltransferase [Bacteroidia bacterium]|nr:FkbM family methyltransferase [Bacteroidia bacterium]